MSLILDALRRGRAQPSRRSYASTAQSDSILETLAYRRRAAAVDSWSFGRIATYVGAVALLAIATWSGVVWLTSTFLAGPAPSSGARTVSRTPPAQTPEIIQSADLPSPAARPAAAPAAQATSSSRREAAGRATIAPSIERSDREIFQRALIAHRMNDLDTALAHYQQAVAINPLNVEAHNNLGLIYRDKGLFAEAERTLQRAIAVDPAYARGRNNLGLVYLSQTKLEAAASAFHAALAIDPSNAGAQVNLALVELESGRREAARRALLRALEIDATHAGAQYNLGLLEDEAGRPRQALSHYQTFLRHGADRHPALAAEVRRRVVQLESVR